MSPQEWRLQWHSSPESVSKKSSLCANVNVIESNWFQTLASSLCSLSFTLCASLSSPDSPSPPSFSLPPPCSFLSSPSFLLSHLHHSLPAAPPLRCRRQRRRRKARWSWRSAASGSCWGEPPMATSRMPSHPCWCETTLQALLFTRSILSLWCVPLCSCLFLMYWLHLKEGHLSGYCCSIFGFTPNLPKGAQGQCKVTQLLLTRCECMICRCSLPWKVVI